MCLFKTRQVLERENKQLKQRISILEGQAEMCENLQQQIEDLDKRNTNYINKNVRLSNENAAFRYKYGSLTKEDFAEYNNYCYQRRAEKERNKQQQQPNEQQQ